MIRIVSLTDAGAHLAQRLQPLLSDSEHWHRPKPFGEKLQQAFQAGDALLLICATGIAVRTLAPVLVDKTIDPPVLVVDELGHFVIPLLSGHEGGANHWANDVAGLLGAQLVQTTAKPYLQPIYVVGMGCERDCPIEFLESLLAQALAQAGIKLAQLHSLQSIDIKADENALITLAKKHNLPFITHSADALSGVEEQLKTPSDYVYKTVGVYGVAESAALYGAQQQVHDVAELIVEKQKNAKATCAIARVYPLADSLK